MSVELEINDSDVSWSDEDHQDDCISVSCSEDNDDEERNPPEKELEASAQQQNCSIAHNAPTPHRGNTSRKSDVDGGDANIIYTGTVASNLSSMFSPTSPGSTKLETIIDGSSENNPQPQHLNLERYVKPSLNRQITQKSSNNSNTRTNSRTGSDDCNEMTGLLSVKDEPTYQDASMTATSNAFFQPPSKEELFPSNGDSNDATKKETETAHKLILPDCIASKESIISSMVGSVLFVLFHIVFCLAQAASIHRPFSGKPILGVMVRQAAVGPLIAGPLFVYALSGDFATVYPSVDCFPAPFLGQMASIIDKVLVDDGLEDDDLAFLTTFGMLSCISLFSTGLLLLIGTKVKLVNLSAYLPYPVMCGFFSSVGVLMWTLAFTVDTGQNVWHVLFGGDIGLIRHCMKHHVGSLVAGAAIVVLGKQNRGLVPMLSLLPIPLVYFVMFLTETSLKEAQESSWFWSQDDFKVKMSWNNVNEIEWEPPLPFGVFRGVMQGKAHMPAVIAALPTAISMALIYFIRCSVHAPALRKNSNNLLKWKEEQEAANNSEKHKHFRDEDFFWEDIDDTESNNQSTVTKTSLPMADVFLSYGKLICLGGLSGGFACLPTISVAGTLYKIGAVGGAPQYGSMVLLAIFYFTEFGIVGYLPKITFSSLLFVSSVEMIETWFFNSYKKSATKSEWIVTPIIVVFTFLVGSLQSVALGLAISTFLFVGTLNKHGVVKFIANGLTVHSVTERNAEDAAWLDQNGDLIQLLVLQSYIFFGNANSCLGYVNSMFEDVPEKIAKRLSFPLPPLPKYLIIDMTMVSGIDTSSIDVFGEIIQLCFRHQCQVYMTGLTPALKKNLSLGDMKPSQDKNSANSTLRFLPEMESALCKAEDGLLSKLSQLEQKEMIRSRIRTTSNADDGFLYALKEIDSQHDLDTLSTLADLRPFTKVVDLRAGESLFHHVDGTHNEQRERDGLYFIEHGMMKVERDPETTTTRGSLRRRQGMDSIYGTPRAVGSSMSLSELHWRTPTIGKEGFLLKNAGGARSTREKRTVRLARLKPGFVIGVLGSTSQLRNGGEHVALTRCRLWHLSQTDIHRLEEERPRLILELFKMMTFMSAQRQEATIDQLATLHQIMTSLAPTKPVDRQTMAVIRNLA